MRYPNNHGTGFYTAAFRIRVNIYSARRATILLSVSLASLPPSTGMHAGLCSEHIVSCSASAPCRAQAPALRFLCFNGSNTSIDGPYYGDNYCYYCTDSMSCWPRSAGGCVGPGERTVQLRPTACRPQTGELSVALRASRPRTLCSAAPPTLRRKSSSAPSWMQY